MFIAVVGKPHDVDGERWDGKIGIFPVIKMGVAKRNSVNRPAGTPVIENLTLSAEVYLDMMTSEGGILDTIKQKMPWAKDAKITVQHDGAPGHNGKGNKVFLDEAGQLDGWNIVFDTQSAQSPDLNLCDLCFFNSLQARSYAIRSEAADEAQLIEIVTQAWNEYDSATLERSWGHLYQCYREIMAAGGSNQYVKPHSEVGKRQRGGGVVCKEEVPMATFLHATEVLDGLNN